MRFAKMVILWEQILSEELGLDPDLALSAGYAVATVYAILKNKGCGKCEKEPPTQNPNSLLNYSYLVLPGKHPWFLKKLPFRRYGSRIEFFIAGEWKELHHKAKSMIARFNPIELEKMREYAKSIVEKMAIYNYDNWFEFWKNVRDKEWEGGIKSEKVLCKY